MSQEHGASNHCDDGSNLSNCPIGDSAPFGEMEELVQGFIQVKYLQSYESHTAAEKILERMGLLEDLDCLIELESVWGEYKTIRNKETSLKNGR